MTAPNIISITSMVGKTAVQAVGISPTDIVTNSASSNKVYKINALYVSNVDGTNAPTVNVDIYRSSIAYHIAKTVSIPADATLDLITKSLYLEEGDSLRLTASAASDLEAVCSYEELT